ncbi:sensor domain-containing protein [Hydrogenimonas cancrithermarum]|uniref:Uncharacterized protein n=1 Tax=Hydrogenimonas cancrithermarum TaxID=2993563 RepID=A0ABM8FP03_9BACT|nr:EAL domain-containing protein [Hydrogenimonas cancrithermarum]BDY13366.1 hypothetical protein HCR_16780 [Hydrogenimonas cancrithermarum]
MHRLLQRLLKKCGVDENTAPGYDAWRTFLEKVDAIFVYNDEERYLLERSLEISSEEMQQFLEASRENYQQRISALINVIPDLIFYVDEDGKYLDVFSQGKDDLLYLPREQIIGRRIDEIFPSAYARDFYETTREAIESNTLQILNYSMKTKGERRFFEARVMPTNIKENGKRTTIAIVRDMTAEKKSIEYLNVIKKIFEDATEGIFIASLDGSYFEVNEAFCTMLGIPCEKLERIDLQGLARFFTAQTFETISKSLETEGCFHGEVVVLREDASNLLAWLTVDTVYNEQHVANYHVAMLTDISELQKSREKLRYTATHDALTKLPNRMLLFEKLDEALSRARRTGRSGALFFIDLDNFKEINDTMGHSAGDMVLIECANRIRSLLRDSDIFGRLGGDEFLLIVENFKCVDGSIRVAEKVIGALNRPFRVGDVEYDLGSSIGIVIFPDDSDEREELVQYADMAMYRAKEQGKNRFHFYSRALDNDVKRHYRIERALKEALADERFFLLFQPQIALRDGDVTGVEALLRIDERVMGRMSPAEFIPVAEESDLILKIGKWVFEACCRQIAAWRKREGIHDLTVAVNLSRRQLMDEGWAHFVAETLQTYEIDPGRIEFEITETTFVHIRKRGYETIKRLQALGCRFSIDDFGTGYSSLANLKQFTVDKLKIDKSFIDEIVENDSDRAIVRASVALAHALGLSVIAEGVESEKQKRILAQMGCDEIQGYLFSRPVKPEEIPPLLSR